MSDVTELTVVMATYNGSATIGRSLRSILGQTHPPVRVAVADDGSVDDTLAIAREFSGIDVLQLEHVGLGAALNAAIATVDTDFVAFLDDDDLWPVDRLERHIAAFRANPHVDIVLGHTVNVPDDGNLPTVAAVEEHLRRTPSEPTLSRLLGATTMRVPAMRSLGRIRTDISHGATASWVTTPTATALLTSTTSELALYRMVHGDNVGIVEHDLARQQWLELVRERVQRQR